MLFKVIYCGEKYAVYSVMQDPTAPKCKFLIYVGGIGPFWKWVDASECVPVEE